jgi:hypothetical protein
MTNSNTIKREDNKDHIKIVDIIRITEEMMVGIAVEVAEEAEVVEEETHTVEVKVKEVTNKLTLEGSVDLLGLRGNTQ